MKLFTKSNIAMVAAEFLGTAVLVTMFIILARTTAVSYFVATSVAVTMAVVYMVFARVSGAHANPAVTFGMWTARKIGTVRGLVYIIAQMVGGFAAWGLYEYLVNKALPKMTNAWDWRVFVAELIGTAIFTMAFVAVATSRDDMLSSSITIGGALFIGVMIAALAVRAGSIDPNTGQTVYKGFVNPAVALATKNFSAVYVIAPLAGGLVGVNLYNEIFGTGTNWRKVLSTGTTVSAPAAKKTTRRKK